MSKVKYEAVKDPKTSADWDAQAKYLRQQLEAARKAQKAAAKQEKMLREEEERRQQIADAMELIEFMKGFTLNNGSTAYEWMTAKLAESKPQDEVEDSNEDEAADSAEEEVEVLEEETTDEDEAENTENHYYQQTGGYYNN